MISAEQRQHIAAQIGPGRLWAISGGRITPIGRGIELPVGHAYHIRIVLDPFDTYTVSRIFRRRGREWVKGSRSDVYADQVGDAAYYASCFRSYDEHQWPTK